MISVPAVAALIARLAAGALAASGDEDGPIAYASRSGVIYSISCPIAQTLTSVSNMAACGGGKFDLVGGTYTAPVPGGTLDAMWATCVSESSMVYFSVTHLDGKTGTMTGQTFPCNWPCSTAKIYQAAPSATPTLDVAICGTSALFYVRDFPTDVTALYREKPSLTSDSMNTTPPPTTAGTSQAQRSTTTDAGSADEPSSAGGSSSNRVAVIVGAVLGSVGGIGLFAAAYYCGWRVARNRKTPQGPPSNGAYGGKAELDGQNTSKRVPGAVQQVPWELEVAPPELDASSHVQRTSDGIYVLQNASEMAAHPRALELAAHPHS
ncbi:hypothetical protein O9K51_03786 [Purpureocillium lavendulum]|uniref:Uncharacterized protein n=1 Tax=Purpureocillium lavendulum TaxID=1247861 RepID=A0AB34FVF4_9HYPO|nr:hypothetical protein O9K51_03786 [Purpureocillium lavendulum]